MKRQLLGRFFFLQVILFGLTISAGHAEQEVSLPEGYLAAKEMERLVYNTTAEVDFRGSQGKGLIYFSPNGELKQIKNDILYKGFWKVRKNDRLCIKLGNEGWDCRVLVPKGEKYRQYVVKKSGNHRHELTYEKFHQGRQLETLQKAPLLPPGTLGKKQLEELFSGKTVESVTAAKGRVSRSYFAADGTVEQVRDGVERYGKWRVADNGRICLQMENLKEKCRIIVKEGEQYKKYIVKKNGRHQHSISYRKFSPGNQL
ncbi:hypothetical protein [Malonomonas rubra]|uniref:hypothetical protein n=1 Tax=Malonomonas rubra TaxID=57040 RepID=UPI0026F345C4|nr:hypothetical protein [Malonomonas rubra]